MGQLEPGDFIVLNALYLRKIADVGALAECCGRSSDAVATVLAAASESGSVLTLGSQYVVTDEGRREVLDFYETAYSEMRNDPEVQAWYERFEVINGRFLQLVSAWQVGGGGPGAGGQDRVYDRLARLVERHVSALEHASNWVPRYRLYAERFRRGLACVEAGKAEYVTSPTVDSLHNIWFEFHEDILALLGRPRETVSG